MNEALCYCSIKVATLLITKLTIVICYCLSLSVNVLRRSYRHISNCGYMNNSQVIKRISIMNEKKEAELLKAEEQLNVLDSEVTLDIMSDIATAISEKEWQE